MAVFDPNDWWPGGSWFKPADQDRRPPEEINREVVSRWLAAVALCLCFAALAPVEHLQGAFAVLLVGAGMASAGLALIRREAFYNPHHLTAWDEAMLSLAAGLALFLWNGS
ncbi:hypothetical protein [Microvirga arabica]|uniref:hypothetical protein n=1 Tax=Microvirga arabica TaxID=1128671 RepID=UPI001939CE5B|nr:hypothetical protein [Microvirga arabica]MBM1171913.1 hypothetical protein [Microvirga arabica]